MKIAYVDLVIAWCVVFIVALQAEVNAPNILVVAGLGVLVISTLLRLQGSYEWQDLATRSVELTNRAVALNDSLLKTLNETKAQLTVAMHRPNQKDIVH